MENKAEFHRISDNQKRMYSTTQRLVTEVPAIASNQAANIQSKLFATENAKRHGGLRTQGYYKRSEIDKPLITVITVVLNGEKSLEKTISSVIGLNYENIEYILVDGGSQDTTLEIIHRYEDVIDYWVSSRDGGIYDAMNKGIMLAQGDYLWFLNSGDQAIEDTEILGKLESTNRKVIYCAPVECVHENGSRKLYYGRLTNPHQGIIYPRSVFEILGLYDSRYKLISDRLYFDKIKASHEFSFYKYQEPVALFANGGVSGTKRGKEISKKEFYNNMRESKTFISLIRYITSVIDGRR